jgi:phosphatidylserine decarboxylase
MAKPHNPQGAPTNNGLESLYMQLIHLLPRNAVSQGVGVLSDWPIPVAWREAVYGEFARQVGAKVEEAEKPLTAYPTLNAFFTRSLREGLRPLDATPRGLVSPVDARVSEFGRIEHGKLVQTKGRLYGLKELLGSEHEARAFEGGHYITLYLSPKDYHRVHFAAPGLVRGWSYHPGHLFPVNAPSVRSVDQLFCVNERVCVYVDAFTSQAPQGREGEVGVYAGVPVAEILVGATCVGRMTLAFDDLTTNVPGAVSRRAWYGQGREVQRGGELGAFNLGSTVVMLIGGGVTFEPGLERGQDVKLGQRLGVCA